MTLGNMRRLGVRVISADGNVATVSVGGDNIFSRTTQWPGGDVYGNFPPGMPLIDSTTGQPENSEGITISFRHPVYGGGAQIEASYYGGYTATVAAFDGKRELGTYSVVGTTTTDGPNNTAPFVGILSDAPNITSLVFIAVHDCCGVPGGTQLGTLLLDVKVHPAHDLDAGVLDPAAGVPEPATWVMMLLGFCGLGFMTHARRKEIATPAIG
jgi:hypothetical protein